jgi:hypothetical protein
MYGRALKRAGTDPSAVVEECDALGLDVDPPGRRRSRPAAKIAASCDVPDPRSPRRRSSPRLNSLAVPTAPLRVRVV